MWHETGHRSEVSCITQSPQKDVFAVGYADGSIRLWSASTGDVLVAFNGHKKAVTALAFDDQGTRLASGSQDTELIIWDILAETGLFRLALLSAFFYYLWLNSLSLVCVGTETKLQPSVSCLRLLHPLLPPLLRQGTSLPLQKTPSSNYGISQPNIAFRQSSLIEQKYGVLK